MEVNVADVKTIAEFEVIEIIGEKDPYPSLLGIDWYFENYVMIDLKKEIMDFEYDGFRVSFSLEIYFGPTYTEAAQEALESNVIDQLYRLTTRKCFDYINPTIDGFVSYRSIQYMDGDSE